MVKILLIASLLLTGCAARYESNRHDCAETDGCWTLQHTDYGWAYCREENGETRCVPQQ